MFYLGEFVPARAHLEQGIALYDPTKRRAHRAVQDPGVVCFCFLAFTLWALGYPDQALRRSHEALALARELSHPFSLVFALGCTALTHCYRREGHAARERQHDYR